MGRDKAFSLRPIGVVHSPYLSRRQAPRQGPEAGELSVIELEPRWAPALEGLAPGCHLWVLTYLHKADEPRMKVHPRGDADRPATGLFNTRAPNRPNPIGLTLVRLEAIEGTRLTVCGLEAIEGTPVLDLKPYVPGLDRPREPS